MKKVLIASLLSAGAIGAVSLPLPSAAAVDISVNIAPPAPRYEVVPGPRAGYVWVPGHWQWNGRRYYWTAGFWERGRPGYAFHRPEWVQRDGRWHYEARRWDRDGDGVPDRRDSRPNDPTRR
jgi:hypothetical protein